MSAKAQDGSSRVEGLPEGVDACDPEHDLRPDALPGPAFQRGILQALVAVEGVDAGSMGPFRIRVSHGEMHHHLRLDEMFKRHRHGELEPADAVEEIKAAVKLPGAAIEAKGPFPRLARAGSLDDSVFAEACNFDADLVVFYVRELPHGHVPLTKDEVRGGWSGQAGRLQSEAVRNLSERTQAMAATSQGEGDETVIGFNSGDGFDAARLLVPGFVQALNGWLPGRALIAIPTRDLLMAVGDLDRAFVEGARAHVREAFEVGGAVALSDRWYAVDGDGVLGVVVDG